MKKITLFTIIACSLGLTAGSASALMSQDYRIAMTWPWSSHNLQEEVNNLNRMRGHLRWQFRNYKASNETRQRLYKVSHDIDGINTKFRTQTFDKKQLRADISSAHSEMTSIERALKVKPRDYYVWK